MIGILRAAAIQICSRGNVDENLERLAGLVEHAKGQGAELITLPENFAFMGRDEEKLRHAERLGEGKISRWLQALARLHAVHIVASGLPEQGPDAQHTFNTSVYYTPEGKQAAFYRKVHLFDVDLADGTSLRESASVAPGNEAVTVETPWGTMGLAVCYDVRFPELFRALADQGARFVVLGAAFTAHTGKDHWLTLLRARAIENQCAFIAPAQWGKHSDKRTSHGRSVILDAWGTVLAEAPDRDCAIVTEIDFADQDRIRRELPSLRHRRL